MMKAIQELIWKILGQMQLTPDANVLFTALLFFNHAQ